MMKSKSMYPENTWRKRREKHVRASPSVPIGEMMQIANPRLTFEPLYA
jgi:hypothetical protein